MCRTCKLAMIACIFLSACGEGTDRNKGNKAMDPSAQQASTELPAEGSDLFSRYGCFACHSLDGSELYGPPLNDLFMKEVSVVRQGKTTLIVADRDYLSRAITDPNYEKVTEYQNKIMPKPVIPEEDVETLVDYLIELGKDE
jgi:cytochrome c oxidase subunit 2